MEKKELKKQITEETNCEDCFHYLVCGDNDIKRWCENYEEIKSPEYSCETCKHYLSTGYNEEKVPCFYCEEFVDTLSVKIIKV